MFGGEPEQLMSTGIELISQSLTFLPQPNVVSLLIGACERVRPSLLDVLFRVPPCWRSLLFLLFETVRKSGSSRIAGFRPFEPPLPAEVVIVIV